MINNDESIEGEKTSRDLVSGQRWKKIVESNHILKGASKPMKILMRKGTSPHSFLFPSLLSKARSETLKGIKAS
jgi:hypothetical protein